MGTTVRARRRRAVDRVRVLRLALGAGMALWKSSSSVSSSEAPWLWACLFSWKRTLGVGSAALLGGGKFPMYSAYTSFSPSGAREMGVGGSRAGEYAGGVRLLAPDVDVVGVVGARRLESGLPLTSRLWSPDAMVVGYE